jgi:hypothetical protein
VVALPAPPQIVALAEDRARARAARDWKVADGLKARIEEAGWRVVDDGLAFSLLPARPPDVEDAGRLCHGAPDAVPSLQQEPDVEGASIVVLASRGAAEALPRLLAALRSCTVADTGILVVAPCAIDAALLADASEVVWSATRFTAGAALRAALRRVRNELVVVFDDDQEPTGDVVAPLRAALDDPTVAVAGMAGSRSDDLWGYEPSDSHVTAVTGGCWAFRRQDALGRDGPGERLRLPGSVATWMSLCLRDEGPERSPRRAVVVALPVAARSVAQAADAPSAAETRAAESRSRAERRDAYRIAERFRGHAWLAASGEVVAGSPGIRAGGHDDDDDGDEGGHPDELS